MKSFYITTTLPYVNAEPHIGFAMEIIRADVIARWKKLTGYDVFFNTGTDEHGLKIYKKAQEEDVDVGKFVEKHSEKFKDLLKLLDIDENVHFIRTTDEKHIKAAQELWRRCEKDIEKKIYKTKYCVGCELEKTDSELVDGKCSIHPTLDIEILEEENYFFKFSNYREKLLNLYKSNPSFVIPDSRFNEIKSFVESGIKDFSISRLKEKMPWGVPVPDDPEHVIYVWFDALTGYISTLGWPSDEKNFKKFWVEGTPTQYAGKDNLRQQSAMWQAMLMSAGLPNSHQIVINGFINSGGQKMSKSLGNVINPEDMVKRYGVDGTRYLLLRHVHPTEDTDITWERLDEWYNAGLANGLGNLVSRITQLSTTYLNKWGGINPREDLLALEQYNCQKALDSIWSRIQKLDQVIAKTEPFKVVKSNLEQGQKLIDNHRTELVFIARALRPFMPDTSEIIHEAVVSNKKPENLFPRKD
ncbi:MAG: methionine--tRNA ligase [bacterium]|nr:methionine--tRNA ligase [bacterium]